MATHLSTHCESCKNLIQGEEHRTHVDGTFYQMPTRFPCVLHDRSGCIFITKEHYTELVSYSKIRESTGGTVAKINIPNGISTISGYQKCQQRAVCPKYRTKKGSTTFALRQG